MKNKTSTPCAATNVARVATLCLSLIIGSLIGNAAEPKPLNEKATSAAWDALNGEKFEVAIKNADQCIDEFRGAERRSQEKLEKTKLVYQPAQ